MSQSAFFWLRLLVHDDLDAGILGALEDRFERGAVIRYDADHVDLLGDQIFHRPHLLSSVVLGRE